MFGAMRSGPSTLPLAEPVFPWSGGGYCDFLKIIPADPVRARNYIGLLDLWRQQRAGDPPPFVEWDGKVISLLSGRELTYYRRLKPDIVDAEAKAAFKVRNLTAILLSRHGIVTEPDLKTFDKFD